jgi:hypothetical protein
MTHSRMIHSRMIHSRMIHSRMIHSKSSRELAQGEPVRAARRAPVPARAAPARAAAGPFSAQQASVRATQLLLSCPLEPAVPPRHRLSGPPYPTSAPARAVGREHPPAARQAAPLRPRASTRSDERPGTHQCPRRRRTWRLQQRRWPVSKAWSGSGNIRPRQQDPYPARLRQFNGIWPILTVLSERIESTGDPTRGHVSPGVSDR